MARTRRKERWLPVSIVVDEHSPDLVWLDNATQDQLQTAINLLKRQASDKLAEAKVLQEVMVERMVRSTLKGN